MKKIYSELSRIQQELKAPKNLFNKFGGYKYRNAEGILESVKPLLNGLALVINDEPVLVGERYYIRATATLTDGEESISATAYAREDEVKKGMDGCQITGSCSSYARKYALNALLMIDDSKDSDDDSLSPKNPANEEKFENPPMPAKGPVTASKVLPDAAKKAPTVDPVRAYLLKEMEEMRKARGLTAQENTKLFGDQKAVLVSAGLAPDKALAGYTMDEAKALVEAMYANFTESGTELVTK